MSPFPFLWNFITYRTILLTMLNQAIADGDWAKMDQVLREIEQIQDLIVEEGGPPMIGM
jgi:hypothetical protein